MATLPAQVEATASSLRNPESFWLPLAHKLIHWIKPPTRALSVNGRKWAWFPDGTMNTCYNCVDRHPPSRIAIQYNSPVAKTEETITYGQLRKRVEAVAAALKYELHVKKGDTVIIYSKESI
jgi:propionyl-CoA synthetase